MIHSIMVCDTTYNVVEASAVNQKKLLTLLGGKLIAGGAVSKEPINTILLKGVLIVTEEVILDQVHAIVLANVVESGTENVVTIDTFQGKIDSYFTLLAEAIKVNLSDFFHWLDCVNQEERQRVKTQQKQKVL